MQAVPLPGGCPGPVRHPDALAIGVVAQVGDVRCGAIAIADPFELVGGIVSEAGAPSLRGGITVSTRVLLSQPIACYIVGVGGLLVKRIGYRHLPVKCVVSITGCLVESISLRGQIAACIVGCLET